MSTSSDRGNANINKSGIENQIEDSEKLVADNPAPTGSYGPFKQERRKGHQVISTATYYQVERRGSVRYGNGEAQDWSDSELESDGASYSGGNF